MCPGGQHVHVYGVLDAWRSELHIQYVQGLKSLDFCHFLDGMRQLYPTGTLHFVLDNAPAHRSQFTREYVEDSDRRIELNFLPPYSPKLNPIEKFWTYTRKRVTHNTYFPSLDDLKCKLARFLVLHTAPNRKVYNLCDLYYRTDPVAVTAL